MSYHLLYDNTCPLCVHFKEGIERLDKNHCVAAVGFDDPLVRQLAPHMSRETLENSFHLVRPDQTIISGYPALPELLQLLPGWRWLGKGLKILPGSERLGEKLYAWIAENRHKL